MAARTSIVWFRKALRLHDNPALANAVRESAHVVPVFVMDPSLTTPAKVGSTRLRFLLECLADLDGQLRDLGSRLVVLRAAGASGSSSDVVATLQSAWTAWGAHALYFESDLEPYAIKRDDRVRALAAADGLDVFCADPHLLFKWGGYAGLRDSDVPKTYNALLKLIAKQQWVPPYPLDPITAPMPPLAPSVAVADLAAFSSNGSVPAMEEFPGRGADDGAERAFPGGEKAGLERLRAFVGDVERTTTFEKPRTDPFAAAPRSTTGLSAYIKFGAVSVRRMYWALRDAEALASGRVSSPPQSLVGQLLWREFFTVVGARTRNYDQIAGNALCRAIPWDHDPDALAAWASGRTGYPLVDAIMRELRATGWIHHLARHVVACFLTRGDLWQSWESGKAVFERDLLDADHFLNAGNWMWLSASAFFHKYYRVYSPVTFGVKYGASATAYVRRWVPELAALPDKHLFAPWDADLVTLSAAGVALGDTYPDRIVDHASARTANLARMKSAYSAKRYGSDLEVEQQRVHKRPKPL